MPAQVPVGAWGGAPSQPAARGRQEQPPAWQHAAACAPPQSGAARRSDASGAASPAGEKRCSYEHCTRPTVSRQFHTISEASKLAGGQSKWGAVMGMTLCDACYTAFSRRGTLGREPRNRTLKSEERRCSYELCARPTESRQFHKISEAGKSVGGHDWSPVVGKVLCNACYTAFSRHGILDRTGQTPREKIATEERRCCNEQCARPTQSGQFHKISAGYQKGGQDWKPVEGKVLCHACYAGYLLRGSLGAQGSASASPTGIQPPEPRRCSYEHCAHPTESGRFFRIKDGCRAGGKDWGPVVGRTLCETCYGAYSKLGTLDRQFPAPTEDLAEEERHCAYEHCKWSTERSPFYRIEEGCKTMGRDWSSLENQVLCQACYMSWSNRGTLERAPVQAKAADARCSYDKCPRPRGSSKYHTIREGCKAGAQDWGKLEGMVLCNPCYSNYRTSGTLERRRGEAGARDCKPRKRLAPEEEELRAEELADDGDVDSLGTDMDDDDAALGGMSKLDKIRRLASGYDVSGPGASQAAFEVGSAVLALHKDGRWYRAEVVRVMGAAKSYEIKWKGGNTNKMDTIKLPREIKPMPRCVADPSSFGGSEASNGSSTTGKSGVATPPPTCADKKKGEGSDSDRKRKERSGVSPPNGANKVPRREGQDGAKGDGMKGDSCAVCEKGVANFCVTPCMHKVLCSQCADASKFMREDTRPISRCPKCSSPVESPYCTLSTGSSC